MLQFDETLALKLARCQDVRLQVKKNVLILHELHVAVRLEGALPQQIQSHKPAQNRVPFRYATGKADIDRIIALSPIPSRQVARSEDGSAPVELQQEGEGLVPGHEEQLAHPRLSAADQKRGSHGGLIERCFVFVLKNSTF